MLQNPRHMDTQSQSIREIGQMTWHSHSTLLVNKTPGRQKPPLQYSLHLNQRYSVSHLYWKLLPLAALGNLYVVVGLKWFIINRYLQWSIMAAVDIWPIYRPMSFISAESLACFNTGRGSGEEDMGVDDVFHKRSSWSGGSSFNLPFLRQNNIHDQCEVYIQQAFFFCHAD